MMIKFVATATTRDISPGSEWVDDQGILHIADRVFTDIVECDDDRVAGINEPALDIELDTATRKGTLKGRFMLASKVAGGFWEGELRGRITDSLVTAAGIAKG